MYIKYNPETSFPFWYYEWLAQAQNRLQRMEGDANSLLYLYICEEKGDICAEAEHATFFAEA
jgi:hypothetical protein